MKLRDYALLTALVLPAVLWLAPIVSACPFCDGGPSGTNEVQAAIFGENFWYHLSAVAVPFAVLLGLAAGIHFGAPPWWKPVRREDQNGAT
jgi:hypothetical protein